MVDPQPEPDEAVAPQFALDCKPRSGIRAVDPKIPGFTPKVIKDWFRGDKSALGSLPQFPFFAFGMSASGLVRLPTRPQYDWWGAPFQIGRMTFDMAFCPFWRSFFAPWNVCRRRPPGRPFSPGS